MEAKLVKFEDRYLKNFSLSPSTNIRSPGNFFYHPYVRHNYIINRLCAVFISLLYMRLTLAHTGRLCAVKAATGSISGNAVTQKINEV